jgi:hypothetical protein
MQQKRICEYFGFPCTHLRSFLDLPPEVRRQIYFEAGLFRGENISLESPEPPDADAQSQCSFLSDEEVEPQFTYHILQTCRTIYEEVKSIICTENVLVVSDVDLDIGLNFLRGLSPAICSRLTDLVVRLYYRSPSKPTDLPLTSWEIAAWQTAITHILSHAQPQRLRLFLICETGDSDKTHAVLQPLLAFPGVLKEFTLRLHDANRAHISALAAASGLRIMGRDPNRRSPPFRFFDLPVEVRRKILEYTDLVTYDNRVEWNQGSGFYSRPCECTPDGEGYPNCSVERLCWHPDEEYDQVDGFMCPDESGYSSLCKRWIPPRALMLVSRAMYQEAIAVFYSCNRIVVTNPAYGNDDPDCPPLLPDLLDASRFITRHLSPGLLHHLRILEIVFPVFHYRYRPVRSDPFYCDWRSAVKQLGAHANISNLTLVIRMTVESRTGDPLNSLRRRMFLSNHHSTFTLFPHLWILDPLRDLKHMKRFFIFLHCECDCGHCPDDCGQCRCECGDLSSDKFEDAPHIDERKGEEHWEKFVMGDEYDSHALGKDDVDGKSCESPWPWPYEVEYGEY